MKLKDSKKVHNLAVTYTAIRDLIDVAEQHSQQEIECHLTYDLKDLHCKFPCAANDALPLLNAQRVEIEEQFKALGVEL